MGSVDGSMGVMIYGAGAYGGLAEKLVSADRVRVTNFVDRKLAGGSKNGIGIISPESIPDEYDGTIYIAVKNSYVEIRDLLKKKKCKDVRSICELLDRNESDLPDNLDARERDAWFQRKTFQIAVKLADIEGIKFNHIEAVVTERCTLNCRDCSSLMPYYKESKDVDLSELALSIRNLLSVVSYIGEIRILGGEPFLNRNLSDFICEIAGYENVGLLSVYTNGMVLPDEKTWDVFRQYEIPIHISDYGIGGEARERFVKKANETGLRTYIRKYDNWYKMGDLIPNGYSYEKTYEMFRSCVPASCPTILHGKLYQCPRAAHADNTGILKCQDDEFVDLSCNIDVTKSKIIEQIAERRKCISTCSFCLGTNDQVVEAAIQKER